MKTITAVLATAALGAVLAGCGGADSSTPADAGKAPQTTAQPAAATPKPTSGAAAESAYVAEAMSLKPELILARAELVKMGHEMCEAFRTKPGDVASLVRNAKADNMSADDVETLRVVAIAAIHNLCTDQSGDL